MGLNVKEQLVTRTAKKKRQKDPLISMNTVENEAKPKVKVKEEMPTTYQEPKPIPIKTTESKKDTLSDQEFEEMAKQRGYKLKKNRTYIKHSLSITPEHLNKMRDHKDYLGHKLQDILFEALEEWFEGHSEEYESVLEARRRHSLDIDL